MVMGSQIQPDLLHDILDGAIAGVVAVESPNAIMGEANSSGAVQEEQEDAESSDIDMDTSTANTTTTTPSSSMESYITRTADEDLPYLFVGSGTCTPLDPKASHSLGLALVRSINVHTRKLELVTPIPGRQIRTAIEKGHGIILVRGPLDNPNWAISEEYYAARAAAQRHQRRVAQARKTSSQDEGQAQVTEKLRDRVRRASQAPWMTVVEDDGRRQREVTRREQSLWSLRKKADPGSESEMF